MSSFPPSITLHPSILPSSSLPLSPLSGHASIREYRPSDQEAVLALFRDAVLEQVYPAFFEAAAHPDHVGVALSLAMAGYVLGGSSALLALLFGGLWAALLYYCCQEVYGGYLGRRLQEDMADLQTSYLDDPRSGLWVAEAEVRGRARVVGAVGVLGKQAGGCNGGGPEAERDVGDGCYGEVSHLAVVFGWRRRALGSRLAQRALEFCKERGYARLELRLSSPQTAAAALSRKLAFVQTASHSHTHANRWVSKMAGVRVVLLEKSLS